MKLDTVLVLDFLLKLILNLQFLVIFPNYKEIYKIYKIIIVLKKSKHNIHK